MIQDVDTADTVSIPNAHNRQVNVDLFDNPTASCSILALDPSAELLRNSLSIDLLVQRDELVIFRGRITQLRYSYGGDSPAINLSAVGYKALLDRRLVLPADVSAAAGQLRRYTAMDSEAIAWDLLQLVQARPNGDMRITRGTNNTTAARTRSYPIGTAVGSAIDKLGRVQQNDDASDIYEWDLEPSMDGSVFKTYSPARGKTDPSFVFDYGGSVLSFDVDQNSDGYANVLVVSGDAGSYTSTTFSLDYTTNPAGALESYVQESSINSATESSDRGRFLMANQTGLILPTYTFHLASWGGPAQLWLGDQVFVELHAPAYDASRSDLRCMGVGVSIDDNGTESVAVEVGYRYTRAMEALTALTKSYNGQVNSRNQSARLAPVAKAKAKPPTWKDNKGMREK